MSSPIPRSRGDGKEDDAVHKSSISSSLSPASRALAVADKTYEEEMKARECSDVESEDGSDDSIGPGSRSAGRASGRSTASARSRRTDSEPGELGLGLELMDGRRGFVQDRRGRNRAHGGSILLRDADSMGSPTESRASSSESWRQTPFVACGGSPRVEDDILESDAMETAEEVLEAMIIIGTKTTPAPAVGISAEDVDRMSVSGLKALARELGIATTGLKAQLQRRIKEKIADDRAAGSEASVVPLAVEEPGALLPAVPELTSTEPDSSANGVSNGSPDVVAIEDGVGPVKPMSPSGTVSANGKMHGAEDGAVVPDVDSRSDQEEPVVTVTTSESCEAIQTDSVVAAEMKQPDHGAVPTASTPEHQRDGVGSTDPSVSDPCEPSSISGAPPEDTCPDGESDQHIPVATDVANDDGDGALESVSPCEPTPEAPGSPAEGRVVAPELELLASSDWEVANMANSGMAEVVPKDVGVKHKELEEKNADGVAAIPVVDGEDEENASGDANGSNVDGVVTSPYNGALAPTVAPESEELSRDRLVESAADVALTPQQPVNGVALDASELRHGDDLGVGLDESNGDAFTAAASAACNGRYERTASVDAEAESVETRPTTTPDLVTRTFRLSVGSSLGGDDGMNEVSKGEQTEEISPVAANETISHAEVRFEQPEGVLLSESHRVEAERNGREAPEVMSSAADELKKKLVHVARLWEPILKTGGLCPNILSEITRGAPSPGGGRRQLPSPSTDKGTGYEGVSGGPGRVAGSKVKSRNDSPSPQGTGRAGASAGTSAEGSRTRAPGSRTSKIRPGGVIAGRSASGSKHAPGKAIAGAAGNLGDVNGSGTKSAASGAPPTRMSGLGHRSTSSRNLSNASSLARPNGRRSVSTTRSSVAGDDAQATGGTDSRSRSVQPRHRLSHSRHSLSPVRTKFTRGPGAASRLSVCSTSSATAAVAATAGAGTVACTGRQERASAKDTSKDGASSAKVMSKTSRGPSTLSRSASFRGLGTSSTSGSHVDLSAGGGNTNSTARSSSGSRTSGVTGSRKISLAGSRTSSSAGSRPSSALGSRTSSASGTRGSVTSLRNGSRVGSRVGSGTRVGSRIASGSGCGASATKTDSPVRTPSKRNPLTKGSSPPRPPRAAFSAGPGSTSPVGSGRTGAAESLGVDGPGSRGSKRPVGLARKGVDSQRQTSMGLAGATPASTLPAGNILDTPKRAPRTRSNYSSSSRPGSARKESVASRNPQGSRMSTSTASGSTSRLIGKSVSGRVAASTETPRSRGKSTTPPRGGGTIPGKREALRVFGIGTPSPPRETPEPDAGDASSTEAGGDPCPPLPP